MGEKRYYIKFEGYLTEDMCVRVHEHKQHGLERFFSFRSYILNILIEKENLRRKEMIFDNNLSKT